MSPREIFPDFALGCGLPEYSGYMENAVRTKPCPPDRDAEFLKLLATHERALAACVHALLPVWEDAEEVLQETRVALWRQFGEFLPGSDFLAWGRTVARYIARGRLRRNGMARRVFADDVAEALYGEIVRPAEREDRRLAALEACSQSLGPDARELLRRCYVEGTKIKEIAGALGRSLDATYMAIGRIRRSLMECIERRLRQEERG